MLLLGYGLIRAERQSSLFHSPPSEAAHLVASKAHGQGASALKEAAGCFISCGVKAGAGADVKRVLASSDVVIQSFPIGVTSSTWLT